jgi:cell fate regulator YaaT (PSP1 superfamily)
MDLVEYLVSYGLRGDFGRFRPERPLVCARGARVVVQSPRGLEIGRVLREAAPGHARFLPNTALGRLLRVCGADDERQAQALQERGTRLLARAGALAGEWGLPLEVLDAEVLLDGAHAVLHQVRAGSCDVRPLVSTLSREFELMVSLADLAGPPEEEHGCGHCGPGGCGSCSTGGCGSCSNADPRELQEYFAGLRRQMDRRQKLL